MTEGIGFKELYQVSLKTTYPIEMGSRSIEAGETVALFDKIQIAVLQEHKNITTARGGYDNRNFIWWEEVKEISLSLSQGVFSKEQLAFLTNAKLINNEGAEIININYREKIESDEKGILYTKHTIDSPIFVYDYITGEKLSNVTFSGKQIFTGQAYREFWVDYYYKYYNGYDTISFGNPLTNGYLSLEGKTRVKDDITGQVKTGIIRIPKLKLLSNLSMRLGNDAVPQVGRLDAVAVPTGARGEKKVMEIIFLNDDIDSDM